MASSKIGSKVSLVEINVSIELIDFVFNFRRENLFESFGKFSSIISLKNIATPSFIHLNL